jgi:shikimate kinase
MRPLPPKLDANVVLIGFMGAGKSSVGRLVADRLGFQLLDTDREITRRTGRTISEIFQSDGETAFRAIESEALVQLEDRERLVISTGGGVVTEPRNHDVLRKLGFVVWLDADEETIFRRVSRNQKRPLLQTENPRERIRSLMEERRPMYQAAADTLVNTTGRSHADVAAEILARREEALRQ